MGETSIDDCYVCPCGRQFKRKAPYERHLDIAHSNAESHKCRTCRKTFGNANTLKMHMNIHSKGDTKIERLTRGGRKNPVAAKRLKSPQGKRTQPKTDSQAMDRKVELNEDRCKVTTELDSVVVVKTEPQSPLALESFEESSTPSVSPSAKENVLPPAKTHAAVVKTLQESSSRVSIILDKDKVHLIDSTNTSHLPLQAAKTASDTLLIKLEDPGHCHSPHVPNLTLLGHESGQDCMVSVQNIGHAATAPSFAQIPESVASQTADDCIDIKTPLGITIQDLDDDSNVRKSSRLKGKTPGWRTWLETDEIAIPGVKATLQQRRNNNSRKSKVKLEGEDYDIIQQVVDMTSGGVFPDIESPELPTTLGSPAEPNMQPSLTNKRCRESSKTVIPCPVCNKEFYSEKYLSMHMSLHRGSNADQPQTATVEEDEPEMKKTKVSVNGSGAHWTCKICNKTFAQNSNFKNHIRTHSDERPFVCEICCIGFKERYHLKKHMLFKHSNELKEECRVCGKKFKDSTAVRAHERIHSDVRPYACRRCGKTFKTSECLWHHENRSKTCGVALDGVQAPSSRFRRGRQARKDSFPMPLKTEIADMAQHQPNSSPMISAVNAPPIQTMHSIPTTVQAMEMITKANIQAHNNVLTTSAMSHSPNIQASIPSSPILNVDNPQLSLVKVEQEVELPDYDLTGLGSDGSLDESSQDADLNGLFPSDEETDEVDSPMSLDQNSGQFDLDDTTSSSSELAQACEALEVRFDPQGKKRFLCIKCSKQFASYTAFDKHMVTHSELRPYKCQVCDIGFKLKVHLKKHNLYRHSSEYPCECSICGKKFKDSSAVRLHERIHSNDRPFKCVCGKSFKTRENLWGHRHRGPCEKNKDAPGQKVRQGDSNVGAYASILDNEIIAHAFVSNNKVTAKAFIGGNGEVTASARVQGSKVSAQASVNGQDGQAQAKVGHPDAVVKSQPQVLVKTTAIPQTVVDMQSSDETSRATSILTSMNGSQHSSLPTAVVAPIKKVTPQPQVSSPPAKGVVDDKGLPPFETFAPTIMSALQKPPTLPPGVSLPHLANQKMPTPMAIEKSLLPPPISSSSIAERCPTIQRYLQQNRPTTTRLPGIQQLFQSHSMAHKNLRNRHQPGMSQITLLRVPPPGTPPTSGSQGIPSPFSPDLHLPPPPPYPGNPNLGGPANADFRSKTPSSFCSGQSPAPLPLVCWEDDTSSDKKSAGPWATDADSLFHELANSPTFSQL